MTLTSLTALSPLDGRYYEKTKYIALIFSEYGLIHERVHVEIAWFKFLVQTIKLPEIKKLSSKALQVLTDIDKNFSVRDAEKIKDIESTTNHDVKAVEYFIKNICEDQDELARAKEFIHFGCTSDDINNLAYARMLEAGRAQHVLPALEDILLTLQKLAHQYADVAMLGRTHGQPATPTTMGKEIAVYVSRLKTQIEQFKGIKIQGKLNGAVGNFNAQHIAYPDIDWSSYAAKFVQSLGLTYNPYTTQIEPHDYIAEFAHTLTRINTILIDFCRDTWAYISLNYFKQRKIETEVGSSTMPHKINPIDFENAEGNLLISNALSNLFAERLPISRLQRDLVDSTILRNIGSSLGYAFIAYTSILKGVDKLEINQDAISTDLDGHWEVLTEALQTVMRRYNLEAPYEQLKNLARGTKIEQSNLAAFINTLDLPEKVKEQLLHLHPKNYVGEAANLAKKI